MNSKDKKSYLKNINYNALRKRIIDLLGDDYLSINYLEDKTRLFNKRIAFSSSNEIILKRYKKFLIFCNKIKKLSKRHGLALDQQNIYKEFYSDDMYFLGMPIDIDRGIKYLEPTIIKHAQFRKKILELASKYDTSNKLILHKEDVGDSYFLCHNIINLNTKVAEIEKIMCAYFKLNKKVNELLDYCGYGKYDLLQPAGYIRYCLFTQDINQNDSDEYIITIINKAKELEKNIDEILKDLKITERYRIEYGRHCVSVKFEEGGCSFEFKNTKESIKELFTNLNNYYLFKKED